MRSLCAARRPSQALPLNRQSPLPHGPLVRAPSSRSPSALPVTSELTPSLHYRAPRRGLAQGVSAPIIGIDLGTTYSCVAIAEAGGAEPKILENAEGQRTTPSVVAFQPSGEILVGSAAKRQALANPQRTVRTGFYSSELANFSYKIVEDEDGMAVIDIDGKIYTPSEISAHVLRKMKETAELRLGTKISQAVVTVPAYFSDAQRLATKKAAEIAGLEVPRILNEPTAAALAYGLKAEQDGHTVAVYDLGGGTFDISILEIGNGVFEVRSTAGDTYLGGEDFDSAVAGFLTEEFKKKTGVDLTGNLAATSRLREAGEKAKCELSSAMSTQISIPFLDGQNHLEVTLTRSKLDQLVAHLIERTQIPLKAALKDAQMRAQDVDQVIMVGGMTRMPKVVETVRAKFEKEPYRGVNPDEAVAAGAAIQAGILKHGAGDLILLDVVPFSIGVRLHDGSFCHIIPRNSAIPAKQKATFITSVDGQTVIELDMYQGEKRTARDNKFLGHFEMVIPPAKKGTSVEVFLEVDHDGTISVTASASKQRQEFGRIKPGSSRPAPKPAPKPKPIVPPAAPQMGEPPQRELPPDALRPTATVIEQMTITALDGNQYEEVRGSISMRQEQAKQLNDVGKQMGKLLSAMGGRGSAAAAWRCPVCGQLDCKFYA